MPQRDRITACLLGGAVGDALGAGVEFDALSEIRRTYGDALPRRDEPTDDTQMTLFTAEGLLIAKARDTDPLDEIRRAYLRWLDTQGEGDAGPDGWLVAVAELRRRRAPGNTCLSALHHGGDGRVEEPINTSKGCGGVMRIAPVAFTTPEPFDLAARAAALTHGHPSGYLSAGAFAAIVRDLAGDVPLEVAVQRALELLTTWNGHDETSAALRQAVEIDGPVSPETVERLGGGWVGEEALAIAVYCAARADDPREALRLSVTHSGDSDSTGSLVGQLLGAMHGSAGIPDDLAADLPLGDVVERIAADLADVFAGGSKPDVARYG